MKQDILKYVFVDITKSQTWTFSDENIFREFMSIYWDESA